MNNTSAMFSLLHSLSGTYLKIYLGYSLLHMQGVLSAKNDGFSLSSGDFPTLGSEKDNPGNNAKSQGFVPLSIYCII